MTENLNIAEIVTITGLVLAGVGYMLRQTTASMNRRFDDAQKANDQAHALIGENIKNLERRIDSHERQVNVSLDRLYTLLAAVTPRAAAEKAETDR